MSPTRQAAAHGLYNTAAGDYTDALHTTRRQPKSATSGTTDDTPDPTSTTTGH